MGYETQTVLDYNDAKGYDVAPGQKLWKYIEFPKFLNILNSNKLYLRRLDKFIDVFEGRVPSFALKNLDQDKRDEAKRIFEARRKLRFVDCWTAYTGSESYAMWKIYSEHFGVVMETSAGNLIRFLPESAQLIKIRYFDFKDINAGDMEDIPLLADPSLGEEHVSIAKNFSAVKSKEYEYENEVRVVVPFKSEEEFITLQVAMKDLIERIVISPYSPQWFDDLFIDIVRNKFGYSEVAIIKSDIEIKS